MGTNKMEYAVNVGQLKEILKDLPDDMPICRFIKTSEKHGECYGTAALELQINDLTHIQNFVANFLTKPDELSPFDTKKYLTIENKSTQVGL